MRRALPLTLLLALAGCKNDLKAEVAEERAAREAAQVDLQTCDASLSAEASRAQACEAQLEPYLNPPVPDLKDRLLAIPGLEVEELEGGVPGHRTFALKLEQPIDHNDPAAGTFKQRMVLTHWSEDAPMVLSTTGYGLFGGPQIWLGYRAEPTLLVQGNQIVLEHRYFEGSMPYNTDPSELDWSYLSVWQSAGDSHRVVQALSQIYGGPWIATGHSKGGMTAIFHQRHYPEDLAGIVPYVAPISFGMDDARYELHMNEIGPADGACRRGLEDLALQQVLQRDAVAEVLAQRDPAYRVFVPSGVAAAVAATAYTFAWGRWQYSGSPQLCDTVPEPGAPADVVAMWSQADPSLLVASGDPDPFEAYSYQVAAELGGPSYRASYLDFAIRQVDFSLLAQSPGPSWLGQRPRFNPMSMQQVDTYLRESARNVLAIYGAWDPWSAGQITVNEANNARVFMAPEVGHAAAIADLREPERTQATQMLMSMAGVHSFAPRWPGDSPVWDEARASRAWVMNLHRGVEQAALQRP